MSGILDQNLKCLHRLLLSVDVNDITKIELSERRDTGSVSISHAHQSSSIDELQRGNTRPRTLLSFPSIFYGYNWSFVFPHFEPLVWRSCFPSEEEDRAGSSTSVSLHLEPDIPPSRWKSLPRGLDGIRPFSVFRINQTISGSHLFG